VYIAGLKCSHAPVSANSISAVSVICGSPQPEKIGKLIK
jgi:hypothetical protein